MVRLLDKRGNALRPYRKAEIYVQLYNHLYDENVTSAFDIPKKVIEVFNCWELKQLVKPLIKKRMKEYKNFSIDSLATQYNVSRHQVYSVGLRCGVYGDNCSENQTE